MSELKPCPFCGGEANTQIFDKVLNVGCPHCDIRTRFVLHDELDAAINAWNTRHVETCKVELRESGWGGYTRHCGACGADLDCDTRNKQNYCPSCGRRVER